VTRGVSAGALVSHGAPVIDGRGGGRPEMAQARGTRRDRLPSALTAIREGLEQMLRDSAASATAGAGATSASAGDSSAPTGNGAA